MIDPGDRLRVDKWLWYARFFKTRGQCTKLVNGGGMRVNAQKVAKAAHGIIAGDTLTFAQGDHIRVIKILALASQRGPAPVAQALYDDLSPPPPKSSKPAEEAADRRGRPTKRDRRAILAFRRSPLE